jgi:L-seryl-tRNA(Ser) seleniumtransferase
VVGGCSLPGGSLPTKLVSIGADEGKKQKLSAQLMAEKLRRRAIPVIGRIEKDCLLLDPRSVFPEDDNIVVEACRKSYR